MFDLLFIIYVWKTKRIVELKPDNENNHVRIVLIHSAEMYHVHRK